MQNNIQIFSFEENEVRTLLIEDEVWFVGKDVATILGYSNTKDALRKHVDPEDKLGSQIATSGQSREMTIINESGLYSLVLKSKLPNAKKFKRWVTSEVLPSIRRTGSYNLRSPEEMIKQSLLDPDSRLDLVIEFATELKEEKQKNKLLELANSKLETKVEEDKPKVECFETFLDTGGLTNFRKSAHLLNIPEQVFMDALKSGKYVYYDASETLLPYAQWKKKGYFEVKKVGRHNGKVREQTFLTPEGLSYFALKFKTLRTPKKELFFENEEVSISLL